MFSNLSEVGASFKTGHTVRVWFVLATLSGHKFFYVHYLATVPAKRNVS